eukprot:589336-Pyramimonas_sp.AAC.1
MGWRQLQLDVAFFCFYRGDRLTGMLRDDARHGGQALGEIPVCVLDGGVGTSQRRLLHRTSRPSGRITRR